MHTVPTPADVKFANGVNVHQLWVYAVLDETKVKETSEIHEL